MTSAALRADALGKRFGGIVVLEGCSFACEEGTITGLVGPNGSGKSTLFNVLSGVVRPDAGEVSLSGRRLTGLRPHQVARAGIARTFQTSRLFKSLSVLDNVLLGRGTATLDVTAQEQGLSLLSRFNLAHLASRAAEALSFGQQRLVELARALMSGPRFILLDEPFAGLSPAMSAELESHVALLPRAGVGVVLVEHDLVTVMKLCPRILVLNRGKLIADGSPTEVRSNRAVIDSYLGGA